MNKLKPTLLLLVLIFMAGQAVAKTSFRGCVVAGDDNEPLPYCMVKCLHSHGGALTDSLGIFEINAYERDSLIISYAGYEDLTFPCADLKDSPTIMLSPRVTKLNELVVKPMGKARIKTYGKKHKKGIIKSYDYWEKGDSYGVSVKAKNKQTWLTHVGFYTEEGSKIKENAKFMINVYDISNAHKSPTRAFVNVLDKPIIIEFHADSVKDSKFTHELLEPILLPEEAHVEFVIIEDETIYNIYSCNLIGSSEWMRGNGDNYWLKNPFPTPFFVVCRQYKL